MRDASAAVKSELPAARTDGRLLQRLCANSQHNGSPGLSLAAVEDTRVDGMEEVSMGDFQGEEGKHLKAITGCRNTGGFLFTLDTAK